MRRRFAFLLAAVLAVPAMFAQSTGLQPLTEHLDVKIINVDVSVTDAQGRPINDLKPEDFEIFEDGKLQTITNFYVIEKSAIRGPETAVAASEAPEPDQQFRRKIVLLVDNNYIDKVERDRALNVVEKYLEDSFNGEYEWSVASIGQSLETLQPLTTDKAAVHAAIETLKQKPVVAIAREMDRSILSDRTRKNLDQGTTYDYGESVRFQAREQTFRNLRAVTSIAQAVTNTARSFAAADGKKVIILLTGGIENNTTFTTYEREDDAELRQLRLETAKVIDGMVREANAANFRIDIINARQRGMIAPQHSVENKSSGINTTGGNILQNSFDSTPVDTTDVDSMPLAISGGTGGSYLTSPVAQSLEAIDVRTSNFYSLGYAPRYKEEDRQFHNIGVKVKRPGVRVSYRRGYLDRTADDRLEQFLRVRMSYDHPTGTLPVKVDIGQSQPREKGVAVPVTAQMPLDRVTVVPIDGRYVGRVHVYVSVFDSGGNNVGFHHEQREVALGESGQVSADELFKYHLKVRLETAGTFTVVITLRDDLSNDLGSALEVVRV